MKSYVWTIAVAALFLFASNWAFGACGVIDSKLRMTLPCVEYAGQRYQLTLDYYPNPSDPSWVYFKFNSISMSAVSGDCASADGNLNITNVCVVFAGKQYLISLDYYVNPLDTSWFYWKLGAVQAGSISIDQVTGPTAECYSTANFTNMMNCMSSCRGDSSCLLNCVSSLMGFSVALQINNSSSSDVIFVLAPGIVFIPSDGDVQPMMVLQEEALTVSPGTSTFCVPTYCLASDLEVPDQSSAYAMGGGTTEACLQEIVSLTQGKDLGLVTFQVQEIIWNCTETGSITDQERAYLQGL